MTVIAVTPLLYCRWCCRERYCRKLNCRKRIVLRTFRSAPSPPLRCACGYPLTAAGGQGPQDNTACDIIQIRFIPLKLPCACGWPPTSAGDQDPQDNTAFDRAHIRSCRLKPGGLEHPHSALTIPIRPWPSSTLPAIPPRYVCGSNSSIFRHGTIYHRTL